MATDHLGRLQLSREGLARRNRWVYDEFLALEFPGRDDGRGCSRPMVSVEAWMFFENLPLSFTEGLPDRNVPEYHPGT